LEVDYYHLLGVSPNATRKEIKLAYRRMAEVYHPDKLRHLPSSVRKEGEDIMRLLNEAKQVLMDPDKRYLYDCRIGKTGSKQDAIIVQEFDRAVAYEPESYVALEKEELGSMMSRVLTGLKEVFVKDKDFQSKIAMAQEIVEARVIEDTGFKIRALERDEDYEVVAEKGRGRKRPRVVLDDLEEEEEIEMTLEFKRVTDESGKRSAPPAPRSKRKSFRIVAIEGEEDMDDVEEFEVQEVDWED
jgi:curved DNA-binding protein CbpA